MPESAAGRLLHHWGGEVRDLVLRYGSDCDRIFGATDGGPTASGRTGELTGSTMLSVWRISVIGCNPGACAGLLVLE
jgi:hypothetical protein